MIVTMLLFLVLGGNPDTGKMQYEFVNGKNVPVEECIETSKKVNLDDSNPFFVSCQFPLPEEDLAIVNGKETGA